MRHLLATLLAPLMAMPAFASVPNMGRPTEGGLGFQPAVTRIGERIDFFHDVLMVIITLITIFVTVLLLWVMVRYNRKANPEPSQTSHNTLLEVAWTTLPALILVGIASLSFPNLFYMDVVPNLEEIQAKDAQLVAEGKTSQHETFLKNNFPDAAAKGFINVKAQGNQWNWTYTYPDLIDDDGYALEFISNGIHKGKPSDERVYRENSGKDDFASLPKNLATDYPMVIPVGRYVRYYTAAADVIHSWTVPAFGVKTDAVPGRLNEGWFLVTEPGVYYGQCSELCGIDHAYMPIEVRVVSQAQYDRWAELMLAGDVDAAADSVRLIASNTSAEPSTQLAANP